MTKLLKKELKLTASPLSFFFIAAAFLTLLPGYPILLGSFFTTLGIFYSYQTMRENNDISYTLLLPVAKSDIVKSKYIFTIFIELCSFFIMLLITLIRMTVLQDAPAYVTNALMCANLTFLGFSLLIFGLFNYIFVRGFFKTGYYFGKPFIKYCVIVFVVIALAETLHHLPGLESLNAFGFVSVEAQLISFFIGLFSFVLLTGFGEKSAEKRFDSVDL